MIVCTYGRIMLNRRSLAGRSICRCRTIFSVTGVWERKLSLVKKKEIEEYWRPKLAEANSSKTTGKVGKYYVLSMFPYPSGRLHMGHVRVYAISDAMSRYRKLQGYDVIHPMGWDAFGLPAENAAFEQKKPPHIWTNSNIAYMKKQLLELGFGFDWDREIRTCDPEYYKWTQYLFLLMWQKGLAYQKEAYVNWDPVDQTVLANEQVDENGCSWRSGAKVEKKLLKQWFLRTSHYASALRDALNSIDHWRDIVAIQQHWIGEISGHWINFEIREDRTGNSPSSAVLPIFAHDPTDAVQAAFIAVSPSHEICRQCRITSTSSDTLPQRMLLPVTCYNPITKRFLPVYVVDDPEFFDKDIDSRLGIPLRNQVDRTFAEKMNVEMGCVTDLPKYCDEVSSWMDKGYISPRTSPRLKDWLISRQRYWGTPIPIVHCNNCGVVGVPEDQLPVALPIVDAITDRGVSLRSQNDWLKTKCPKCGDTATRETDTMDTFVDSSWYFLRFLDPHNDKEPFSKEKAFAGMPVDVYIGGKEHALLHLFYARFFGYFLYEQGLLPEPEPFKQLLSQGFVMGKSFRSKTSGRYLKPQEIEISGARAVEKATGEAVVEEWEKMSKSRYNGLDPDDAIREYGVDAVRLFMLGNISPRSHRKWDPELFRGLLNWQQSLWMAVEEYVRRNMEAGNEMNRMDPAEKTAADSVLFDSRNFYLKGVNFVMDMSFSFNMAISKVQALSNTLKKVPSTAITGSSEYRKTLEQTIIMLFPFCPHFASELWSGVRSVPKAYEIRDKNVWEMAWPRLDYSYPLDLTISIMREEVTTIKLPRPEFDILDKEKAWSLAMSHPDVTKWITSDCDTEKTTFLHRKEYEAFLDISDVQAAKIRKDILKNEKAIRKESRSKKDDERKSSKA